MSNGKSWNTPSKYKKKLDNKVKSNKPTSKRREHYKDTYRKDYKYLLEE